MDVEKDSDKKKTANKQTVCTRNVKNFLHCVSANTFIWVNYQFVCQSEIIFSTFLFISISTIKINENSGNKDSS